MTAFSDIYLSRAEVAAEFPVSQGTLANWVNRGRGPRPFRINGRVFYRRDDVELFFGMREPTAPAPEAKPRGRRRQEPVSAPVVG